MKKEYKYFIENSKGEWYRHDIEDFGCLCDSCIENRKSFYPWTIDPLEAIVYPKESLFMVHEIINGKIQGDVLYGTKITEHEFI